MKSCSIYRHQDKLPKMWSQEENFLIKRQQKSLKIHTDTHTHVHWEPIAWSEERLESSMIMQRRKMRRRRGSDAERPSEQERQREEGEGRVADTWRRRGWTGWNIKEWSAMSVGRHRSHTHRNRQSDQNQQRHCEAHWHTAVMLTLHTSKQQELFIHEQAHTLHSHISRDAHTVTHTHEHWRRKWWNHLN